MHHSQPQFRSLKKPLSLNLGAVTPPTSASGAEEPFGLEPPSIQFGDDMAILIESIFEQVDTDVTSED